MSKIIFGLLFFGLTSAHAYKEVTLIETGETVGLRYDYYKDGMLDSAQIAVTPKVPLKADNFELNLFKGDLLEFDKMGRIKRVRLNESPKRLSSWLKIYSNTITNFRVLLLENLKLVGGVFGSSELLVGPNKIAFEAESQFEIPSAGRFAFSGSMPLYLGDGEFGPANFLNRIEFDSSGRVSKGFLTSEILVKNSAGEKQLLSGYLNFDGAKVKWTGTDGKVYTDYAYQGASYKVYAGECEQTFDYYFNLCVSGAARRFCAYMGYRDVNEYEGLVSVAPQGGADLLTFPTTGSIGLIHFSENERVPWLSHVTCRKEQNGELAK